MSFEFKRCPYFVWNGEKSTDYGVVVTDFPDIVRASERVTFTAIPGRNGSLTQIEGEDVYDDVTISVECTIKDFADIRRAAAFMRGAGTLAFPYRPYEHTKARLINQISFEEILKGKPGRTFKVNFRAYPFWISDLPTVYKFSAADTVYRLMNEGDVQAEPIITCYGSGNGSLTVNGQTVEVFDLIDKIVLDTPNMEAYSDTENMNMNMSGEFPVLKKGLSELSFSGGVTSVDIKFNAMYLV